MNNFKPFNIKYLVDPLSFEPKDLVIHRTLKDVQEIFVDRDSVTRMLKIGNPKIIDVYMAPIPERLEHLMVLMTRIYPGEVGNEFFMTKGHIHESENAPEVYLTLKGEGKLLLQTSDNQVHVNEMVSGEINYIPSNWAHRAVNTGSEELIFLGIYPASSRRDYSFIGIGKKNFLKIVVNENGIPAVIDNPRV